MSLPISSRIDRELVALELNSELQNKARLLYPLILSGIGLHIVALIVMLVPPITSNIWDFSIVGASAGIQLLIFWFYAQKRFVLATMLFCATLEVLLAVIFVLNIVIFQNPAAAVLFGYMLALTVVLAGMLLKPWAIMLSVMLNVALITGAFALAADLFGDLNESAYGLGFSFPISVFIIVLGIISWLYQTNLIKAEQQLDAARQQIFHDSLMRRDLEIARDLQQQLYPDPPAPDNRLTIASRSESARETSGDFYDFIDLGENRLGIVMADVTGKSLAAAMVMTMTRSILRNEARRTDSPADVLVNANQTMCSDRSVKQMVTAFYGILDLQTLTLRFSNAGHPYPIIKRDGAVEENVINGLPLGAKPDESYDERSIQLCPGDQIILISDGVIEEMNERREIFGYERLRQVLYSTKGSDANHMLQTLWNAVVTFRGGAEQNDDVTLVIVQVGVSQCDSDASSAVSSV